MPLTWFDAHLDLAYLAVMGRNMAQELDAEANPHPPASITLPSLRHGGVAFALATVFTEPVETTPEEPFMYPAGNAERAHAVGRAQLEAYLTWRDRGLVRFGLVGELGVDPGVGEIRGGMGVAELVTPSLRSRIAKLRQKNVDTLRIGILMENADPIRTPAELGWWVERGVKAIGLAWARASRYAGGNSTDIGLTDPGRELVREMDRLAVAHDVSHLSDRALADLLAATNKPVVASHSNARALLGEGAPPGWPASMPASLAPQRHLTDATIREVGRRGGVIGLNLFSKFLTPKDRAGQRATIDDAIRHVEHVCDVIGHRRGVGLGSDMDGGFAANMLPTGIDTPSDLQRLADGLAARGWSDDEVWGFACENWVRFFETR